MTMKLIEQMNLKLKLISRENSELGPNAISLKQEKQQAKQLHLHRRHNKAIKLDKTFDDRVQEFLSFFPQGSLSHLLA